MNFLLIENMKRSEWMEEPSWPVCVKEMGSTKNDETIPGSEEMEWGPLPHKRKERMLLHFPSASAGGPWHP